MIYLDTETFSPVDLPTCGVYRYAEQAEVLVAAYAIDEGPAQVWDRTRDKRMPGDLAFALDDPAELIYAHGAMFDRTVLRLGDMKLEIPIERWRCSMAHALAHSLPAGLDALCTVLQIDESFRKMKIERQLMMLFCKPRKDGTRASHATHPGEWKKFAYEYAPHDITAMREVVKKLPTWNYRAGELALWHLDQRINDRGIRVDAALVSSAIRAAASEGRRLDAETGVATGGSVASSNQRDRLLEYILLEHGVNLPDLTASTLERRAEDPELPQAVRDLINIRLQTATASVSKYKALSRIVSTDGRMRGTLQFCGALRTGRWSGKLFQPQNLFRPDMKPDEIDEAIELVKAGELELVHPEPMRAMANMVRGALVAPPGKELVVADLSNIEGRDQAWLAGEEWKLEAFRQFDLGVGDDLYKIAYGRSFNVSPGAVDKGQRQVGKVQELSMGYQGGVAAFVTMADTYKLNLEQLSAAVWHTAPGWAIAEAQRAWDWAVEKKRTLGLDLKVYVACDTVKRLWRHAHPQIVTYWAELESAARDAALQQGVEVPCRRVMFKREKNWLKCYLPSGRVLGYPGVRVDEQGKISYLGINTYTKRWARIRTYGGKFFEQQCQALARDVMAQNMPAIEAGGFDILATVHDEVITEAAPHGGNVQMLCDLLAAELPWSDGLPLAAGGFAAQRYRKE